VTTPRLNCLARATAILIAAFACGSTAAIAIPSLGPAPLPSDGFVCPTMGIVARLSGGITFRFAGGDPSDPEVCLWSTETATGEHRSRFLRTLYNLKTKTVLPDQMRTALREFWPLTPGRTVNRLVSGATFNSSLHLVYANEGLQRVTVPAGTFTTWLLHETATGVFGNEMKIDNRYWIDEATGVPVRISENTNGNIYTTELVALTLP
jgi:hypothetical protein